MEKKSEDLNKLWKLHHNAYLQGDGEYYRNKLLEACLPKIEIIVNTSFSYYSENDKDDLKQEGVFGALKAIKKFNPKKKGKFLDYLKKRVEGNILDYVREEDRISVYFRQRAKQSDSAELKLIGDLERIPTEQELIKELSKDIYFPNPLSSKDPHMSLHGEEKAKKILKDSQRIGKQYFVFPLNNSRKYGQKAESSDVYLKDQLEDKRASNSLKELQKKDFFSFLFKRLSVHERILISLYYSNYKTVKNPSKKDIWKGMTHKEIGKTIDLSKSRISQIHSKLIIKLRSRLTRRGLTLESCLNDL